MVRVPEQRPRATPSAIAGGFVLVPVATLMVAWRACRSRPLGVGDFRIWLACREMDARRCSIERGRSPIYTFAELSRLAGVSEKRARASVARLVAAGILLWSESAIGFPRPVAQDDGPVAQSIGSGRGTVAIPRRLLRLLADGARPALIATALGVLLRCLSRRRGGFDGRGRAKASWIATVFGVDVRRVKAARRDLVELGWIEPEADDQWAMNRWGRAYRINLGWGRVEHPGGRPLPPLPMADESRLPPPESDQDPLREGEKNQEPVGVGPTGVELERAGERGKPLPDPTLDDVKTEDLRDTGRTLKLFDQAVARGLAGPSEASRLRFVAIAEHARRVGTVNPGGLLAQLVRRGHWSFATQEDEDSGRRRLREHLHGSAGPAKCPLPTRLSTFVPENPAVGPATLADLLAGLRSFRPN